MLFMPVSYSNALIVNVISATATDVRKSAGELRKSPLAPRWRRFSHKWRRFHFRAETCATGATQKADSRCRFSPCFGTCTVDTRNLRRLLLNLRRLLLIVPNWLKTKNCQGITLGSFKTHYTISIFLLIPKTLQWLPDFTECHFCSVVLSIVLTFKEL